MKLLSIKTTLLLLILLSYSNMSSACQTGSRYNIDTGFFSDNGWHQPLEGTLTTSTAYDYDSSIYNCNFGFRHGAYDFVADDGDDVFAIDSGEVLHIVVDDSATQNLSVVFIKHNSAAGDFIAKYGHVSAEEGLDIGDKVEKGQVIGEIESFGTPVHIHFGISSSGNDNRIYDATFGGIKGNITNPITYLRNNRNLISRAEALELILDKFNITNLNAGFNGTIFGEQIIIPDDVEDSVLYDYIVTAYNRGIARGSSGKFRPTENISLAEFIIMIDRTIPIPLENPDYNFYSYSQSEWYYKYVNAAFNANIIDNIYYPFSDGIDMGIANETLNRAYQYYLGPNSGISIYANWSRHYADMDLYLYSSYDGNSTEIKHDSDHVISNMNDLRNSGGIVYWYNHSSSWGANLDYDSWGGNGNQPWAGFGEERITVDSKMVRRPGKYSIIFCYYDWNQSVNPSEATVEWWGINKGKNINRGGNSFFTTVSKGECVYSGTLSTN